MKVCIACQKDVEGKKATPIKEDRIIRSIRAIKSFLHMAKNNELYVCEDDLNAQLERRRSFEGTMLLAAILAGIIILLLLFTFVFSGRFDFFAFFSGIVLSLFVLALPLFKYAPAIEGMPVSAFKPRPKNAQAKAAAPVPQPAPIPPAPAAAPTAQEAPAQKPKTRKKK